MNRTIPLSDICLTFDQCESLNNTQSSALAWVFNPFKNIPEWEVVPVSDIAKMDHEQIADLLKRFKDAPGWELYPAEVFVSQEQIRLLIEQKKFYYAPLK